MTRHNLISERRFVGGASRERGFCESIYVSGWLHITARGDLQMGKGDSAVSKDGNTIIELTGRYSRTIKVYLLVVMAYWVGWSYFMIARQHLNEWPLFLMSFVVLMSLVVLLPMLVLYSKPIKVEVRSNRLYIRDKRIDVTHRIKTIRRRTDELLTIRFNVLYQLDVTGSPEQITQVVEQLHVS